MSFKVLLVDDDKNFAKIVSLRLKSWRPDCNITMAHDISSAKAELEKSPNSFALAILDYNLPDGLGKDLFEHQGLKSAAVVAMSSDDAPEIAGNFMKAGAEHFLTKRQVTEPLFIPLLEAVLERKEFETQLLEAQLKELKMQSIKTLLSTLRHEINNPLGAVLGGTYLIKMIGKLDDEQTKALKLIEASGKRIKDVIEKLCDAADLEMVTKGNEDVFHVPGDAPWSKEPGKKKSES